MTKREAWALVGSPELAALMRDPMVDTNAEGFALYHRTQQVWPPEPVERDARFVFDGDRYRRQR